VPYITYRALLNRSPPNDPAFAGFDSRVAAPQPGQSVGVLPPGVTPPQLEGVGVDEHLGRAVDLKLQFTDETGYQVPLESFFS